LYIIYTILELGDREEIVRSVAKLVYFKWQGVEFQEPVPKKREKPDIDEEAAATTTMKVQFAIPSASHHTKE
jgi:hypothetical protein